MSIDPEPWQADGAGVRGTWTEMGSFKSVRFNPRSGYSQDKNDYREKSMSETKHGSGVIRETLAVVGEDHPLLVSEDETHLFFRGRVYRLEVDA